MKRVGTLTTTVALMLNLGVASVYAQHVPVMLSFSGTSVPSTINIQPGACPGTDHPYFGGGVFRFQDGSLLMVSLTQGSDCLQFTPTGPVAYCTRAFQITGGTGRFKHASGGTIALTETVLAVLFDASSNPIFFAVTGEMTGMVSGLAMAAEPQDVRQ